MTAIEIGPLGHLPDGRAVERYTLRSAHGITAELMSYGATLMALRTPDRNGRFDNIVLGFDALAPYLAGTPYFGATIGRYANRIAGARFSLDGSEYRLAANDGANSLHGGKIGFDKTLWAARALEDGVAFTHLSPDGDEGYPGALSVEVSYRLSDENVLSIEYCASATNATPVNLTHHSYFNLSGAALRDITDHQLAIDADCFTPVDEILIPTGELAPVAGTPFDFRGARRIGAEIDADHEQLRLAGGYDHNFVLNKPAPNALSRAAIVAELQSGRVMEIWTTEPGLQFYSGNFLDGSLIGEHGPFARRTGLCLEPQHFPNSPNEPRFPSTILRPGGEYRSRTEFRFSTG